MEQLNIKYSELRITVERLFSLTKRIEGDDCILSLKTSVNNDLQYLDLDWDYFLLQIENEFSTQMEGLVYEEYFPEVGYTVTELWKIPMDLIIWIYNLISINILHLSSKKLKLPWNKNYPDLSLGDLVVSILFKRFIRRKDVKINIINTNAEVQYKNIQII